MSSVALILHMESGALYRKGGKQKLLDFKLEFQKYSDKGGNSR